MEGVGFSFTRQKLIVVHSELGALITEKYKAASVDIEKSHGLGPKRDIKRLLFQTRNNNVAIPDQPKTKNNGAVFLM